MARKATGVARDPLSNQGARLVEREPGRIMLSSREPESCVVGVWLERCAVRSLDLTH